MVQVMVVAHHFAASLQAATSQQYSLDLTHQVHIVIHKLSEAIILFQNKTSHHQPQPRQNQAAHHHTANQLTQQTLLHDFIQDIQAA